MSKVSIKTLRYYDEIGILKPDYIDPESSYRFYTSKQLFQLHDIKSFIQIGLSLNEIKLILSGKNKEQILKSRYTELIAENEVIKDKIKRIKIFISKGDETMDYKVVTKDVAGGIIYSKKMVVKDYSDYFKIIPKIGEDVTRLNPKIKCATPAYNFIIYLDGEYKDEDRSIEFCEMVDSFGVAPEGVEFKEIKPAYVASVMHKGGYNGLRLAYASVAKWVDENKYTIADNPRESFIDGIWNKADEKDWLTEIQIPIIK